MLTVNAKRGDTVGTGVIITLAVPAELMLETEFAQSDAGRLAVGDQALVLQADQPQTPHPVTITEITAAGKPNVGVVRHTVRFRFDEPPGGLKAGQRGTAHVVLAEALGVLYLPEEAIRRMNAIHGEVTLLDGTVKPIRLGLQVHSNVAVTGLGEGDTVLLLR